MSVISSHPWIWISAAVIAAFPLLWIFSKKLGRPLPLHEKTWQSYLRGQGALLFTFLLLGSVFGWISGRGRGEVGKDIKLIEYRQLALAGHPVYEDLNPDGYNYISVYAKASSPTTAKITLRIMLDENDGTSEKRVSIENDGSAWSRLEERISGKPLTLVIGSPQPNTSQSNQADILVFLSKR